MNNINKLKVLYHGTMVGTLVKLDKNLTAFEYDKQWLNEGFSISPFSLPLCNSERVFKNFAIKNIGINNKKAKDIVEKVKSTIDEYRLLERI